MTQRLPEALRRLLDQFPAVGVESRVAKESMEQAKDGAEQVTKYVCRDLSHHLARFIVENIIVDKPGVLAVEESYQDMTTRFRAQVYVLSPAEMRSLLRQAFEAGRRGSPWYDEVTGAGR